MIKQKLAFFTIFINIFCLLLIPATALAEVEFNPHFIISDQEMRDLGSWTRDDIQKFLDSKGSYLRIYNDIDIDGVAKPAADIIYNAATANQINPKFLLVTLQKEQSLITDDSPTQKQLNWATGYAVCDSCSMDDPNVVKHKGFAKQVDDTASLIRWYYENTDKSFVKKKDTPIRIDDTDVTPQSWATAFLYTYTPHIHGNKNFFRIWNTWFSQFFPEGTLLQPSGTDEYWIVQNGQRRKFITKSSLITRADPKMAIVVGATDLTNYPVGPEISFANYSLLQTPSQTYLLDYDTLRPFASAEVVGKLGYNPQEVIEVAETDIASYSRGEVITADTKAPQGLIYKITDGGSYYLLKDNKLYPLLDKKVAEINYKSLVTEKHKLTDLREYEVSNLPLGFKDGTLLKTSTSPKVYVIEKEKKRLIADGDTFVAMGYKKSNIIMVDEMIVFGIPEGAPLFLNASLVSAKNKFLGDSESQVEDMFKSKIPAYLAAEYPSGRIISGKDIDTRRSVASFTKLLTAYEALKQNIDLNKVTTYDDKKYQAEGNVLQLVNGEKIRNKDLFNTMLIRSVNNTARMIAQATPLSEEEFVNSMQKQLEDWGADNTSVEDVTGINENNKSTPRDLLKIFTKVLTNKTIKDTLFQTNYTFKEVLNKNKITTHALQNTNQLIQKTGRNYRILASKTGYLEDNGSNMIMLIESRTTKKQYIIVTMGEQNYAKRFNEPHNLAQWISTGKVKIANSSQ